MDTHPSDLSGYKVGELTVLELHSYDKYNHQKWLCKCSCGNTTIVFRSNLLRSSTKSCGCKWFRGRKPIDIEVGTRFGKLTVIKSLGVRKISYGENKSVSRSFFLCRCDCGNCKEASRSDLRSGLKSCGCLKRGKCKK